MDASIRVRVLLFAALKEQAGRGELGLELPAGSAVGDAARALARRVPALAAWLGEPARVSFAVNQAYVDPRHGLADGDELALIPPVSGGAADAPGGDRAAAGHGAGAEAATEDGRFAVTRAPLAVDAVARLVVHERAGALCTFCGTVREFTGEHRTRHLEYDAYAPMVVREMQRLAEEIRRRWPGAETAMHHRIGRLEIGEVSVVVAVAAPHRPEAFAACRHGIDELKRRVPVWKKEVYADGSHWVGRDATFGGG